MSARFVVGNLSSHFWQKISHFTSNVSKTPGKKKNRIYLYHLSIWTWSNIVSWYHINTELETTEIWLFDALKVIGNRRTTLSKRVSLLRMEISFWTGFPFSNKTKMCHENVNPIPIQKIYFRWEANHINILTQHAQNGIANLVPLKFFRV